MSAYTDLAGAELELTTTVPSVVAAGDTIDTVSSEGDPVLGVFASAGENEGGDDSDEGAGSRQDPYLELELPAGVHFISPADYWGDPLVAELSLTTE